MESITLNELFWVFIKINTVTFGGGYTIAPIIKDEFCRRRNLIDEETMLNIIALAQSGPGALAVSTSLLTGYRVKGIQGALVSIVASVLPPLIIISIIYFFYDAFASNYWVRSALRGMSGIISAVLLVTVAQLAKSSLKKHKLFASVLMVFSFLVSWFTSVNTAVIIVILAFVGLITFSIIKEELVL